jgi:hypothetical protein
MGADISDINNDGYPEISTDMLPDEDFRLKTLGSFEILTKMPLNIFIFNT